MPQQIQRWIEVTPSQFPHELEGLNLVKAILPELSPFRAWSNFEFRDRQGKWHEIDLLVLGRRRLHLVELKWYSGTLRGDDLRWLRDGHRAEDSPLLLARRKAQRLKSKLQDELTRWAKEHGQHIPDPRDVVPYVQESVFLHHPGLRCELPANSRIDLFGLDGDSRRSGLPGISERLLEAPTPHQSVSGNRDQIIAALLANIGVVQRRQREAGSWVIDEDPIAEGDGWQDWPAFHRVTPDERHRVRFYVTAPGSASDELKRVRRLAEHEYRVMSRLAHDGLLQPRDIVDADLGIGLVYADDERFQRLDLWLADQAGGVAVADQLSIVRQVAETVGYAHGNRVVHRDLTPNAVRVRRLDDGSMRVLVGDWQSAGSAARARGSSPAGVTDMLGATERLTAILHARADQVDRPTASAFQAPEGVWSRDADRVRLDVFALGALTYYLVAGRPPAADRAALQERLRRDRGLDLAADLPQVSSAVRTLVLKATRPVVSERLGDVGAFLRELAGAERLLASTVGEATDPLEAQPGEILDGRFRLERRLGAGSTAVGLLVTDLSVDGGGPEAERVLKVAQHDAAAARLVGEAEVLTGLSGPRLVRMIEGPIEVGTRPALLLANAGSETLGDVLEARTRLSLDLLERWGTDLLEALVALDRAGVTHRDIKPANLGVHEGRGDRVKHLVLFDFSLSRASTTALSAGTPPYLDPFLGDTERGRFDSAAERYAAAAVLFEMATGGTPVYGDPLSDPASVRDELTIDRGMFDQSVAGPIVAFFSAALARKVGERHHTAAEMLADWRAAFAPVPRTVPDDASERAEAAQPPTLLTEAGLSARALSALEPLGVATVGDVVALDPVRLNHLSGVAEQTRREVKARARRWRERFAGTVARRPAGISVDGAIPDVATGADLLVRSAGPPRAESRRAIARLLLGVDPGLDAFASQAEIKAVLGVTRARVSQQVTALQDAWAADARSRDLLDVLNGIARQALADLGGVATVYELTDAVLAATSPTAEDHDAPPRERVAAGLVRLALDRGEALNRAEADDQPLTSRRRGGRIAVLATDAALLDAAEAVGQAADRLLAEARESDEQVVPSRRAVPILQAAFDRARGEQTATVPDLRLLRLAVELSTGTALSGSDELHDRNLDLRVAASLALKGIGGAQPLAAQEVRDRVRARFPSLPPLPERPALDQLLIEAQLGLVYDEQARAYRSAARVAETGGLDSRPQTLHVPAAAALVAGGHVGHRLSESARARSFLVLGVDAVRADRAMEVLVRGQGASVLDLTGVLVDEMHALADAAGLGWDLVRAADAASVGTREAQGLAALVQRALPAVDAAIERATSRGMERPVLLVEAGPLARWDALAATLARWSDLTTARGSAVWLLAPQLAGNQGPVIDGRPLPLAAPGQFFRLDAAWIDSQLARPTETVVAAVGGSL